MGSIFFGIALALQALTGYEMSMIMMVMGLCIIFYTVMGGIEAVIWTEVVQGVIKTAGAVLILYLVIADMPGGVSKIIEIGKQDNKFSLGSFSPDFTQSTFWMVLLYGFFINLNNFGMDQNYVQRYHTVGSAKEASRSVWFSVWMYVPVSLLFFVIGSCLYAYYQVHPEAIEIIKMQVAREQIGDTVAMQDLSAYAAKLTPADYGDKIVPYFIVTKIPTGLMGIILAALLSAAMSTISSGMNASATLFAVDIYKRYFKPDMNDKQNLRVLHIGTICFGLLGMGAGIFMIDKPATINKSF